MSDASPGSSSPDRYGRWLLTGVGTVVIIAGFATLWLANGTTAIVGGTPLIILGLALVIMAAFFGDVGGILHTNKLEMWWGRGRHDETRETHDQRRLSSAETSPEPAITDPEPSTLANDLDVSPTAEQETS